MLYIHVEKSTYDFRYTNRNQILFTVFRLIFNQTEFRLVLNQSKNGKCKYNLISVEAEFNLKGNENLISEGVRGKLYNTQGVQSRLEQTQTRRHQNLFEHILLFSKG